MFPDLAKKPVCRSFTLPSRAFTLVELLVVIGIIVVLVGILLPVVSHVRIAGQSADTNAFIAEISGAIERYYTDFRAYPGPLSNDDIMNPANSATNWPPAPITGHFSVDSTASAKGFDISIKPIAGGNGGPDWVSQITMSQNLVLGLLGGLKINSTGPTLVYDPSQVGTGPLSLSTTTTRKYPPYMDAKNLSWRQSDGTLGDGAVGLKTGAYRDSAGVPANNAIIPVFVDRFTDSMPILYLRAKQNPPLQTASSSTPYKHDYNPIITDDLKETGTDLSSTPQPAIRAGAYDLSQVIAYTAPANIAPFTGQYIGPGKTLNKSKYVGYDGVLANPAVPYHGLGGDPVKKAYVEVKATLGSPGQTGTLNAPYPFDAYAYFKSSSGSVRQKDGYILISAGPDRVYGTYDDITNFGPIGQ